MYYAMDAVSVLKKLNTSTHGLSSKEAEDRLIEYGKNTLSQDNKISIITLFVEQVKDVFVLLLLFAFIVSFFFGDIYEAILIGLIIAFDIVLGVFQNYKAEKALNSLKHYISNKAKVIRDGKLQLIDVTNLVPGDIVVIESGDRVPADGRLLKLSNLFINESILTGESTPVEKHIGKLDNGTPITERTNMVFAGTYVIKGRGVFVVTATGLKTELGKIAKISSKIKKVQTPLQVKLSNFAKKLSIGILIIILLIFAVGSLRDLSEGKFTTSTIISLFMVSIALAVSAVPEGLPAVVTVTLSLGAKKLAKNNALVRRLSSVETLGSVDVICVDKTGTLTKNEMTIKKIYVDGKIIDVTGIGYEASGDFLYNGKNYDSDTLNKLLLAGACSSDAKISNGVIGDPTDAAFVVAADKKGIKKTCKRLKEIPFTSDRIMVSTINEVSGKRIIFSKGAVESILERATRIMINGNLRLLTKEDKEKILKVNSMLASNAMRVIAVAYNRGDEEKDLIFLGLVGIIDPPRKEVYAAYKTCVESGIKTVMITGDHEITAKAIAKDIGIYSGGKIITGEKLNSMSDSDLLNIIDEVEVFARILPEQKMRIVKAFQSKGHVVAMTGDGVNDAPALKQADIGISVNSGTDVAKDSSDLILLDDNYATIVKAVLLGREIYSNIRKFSFFLMRSNFDEIAIVGTFSFIGFPIPFTAQMILWENLVTDGGPAFALSIDPVFDDVMHKPPRKKGEGLLNGYWPMIIASFVSQYFSTFFLYLLALFLYADLAVARSMVFVEATIRELIVVWNTRSESKGIFRLNPFSNKWLFVAVLISASATLLIISNTAIASVFGGASLNLEQVLISLGFASIGIVVMPEWFYGKKIKLFKKT